MKKSIFLLSVILFWHCSNEEIDIDRTGESRQIDLEELRSRGQNWDTIMLDGCRYRVTNPYKNRGGLSLKGGMHNHTDNSVGTDGYRSGNPFFIGEKYRDVGDFDFYTFTDHNYVTNNPQVPGIIWMGRSVEDTRLPENGHHLCVYNLPENYEYDFISEDINKQIEYYHSIGAVVSYAHPDWAPQYQPNGKMANVDKVDFVEVLNPESPQAGGSVRAFQILNVKMNVWGVGVDDYHYNDSWPNPNSLFNQAFIIAYAKEKTKQSIWEALLSGSFYASKGARMDIRCEEGMIYVVADRVSTIEVMAIDKSNPERERTIVRYEGERNVEYRLNPDEPLVWIRVHNENGWAYSQVFKLEEIHRAE